MAGPGPGPTLARQTPDTFVPRPDEGGFRLSPPMFLSDDAAVFFTLADGVAQQRGQGPDGGLRPQVAQREGGMRSGCGRRGTPAAR